MNSINWEVDKDHSSVEFSVTHLMINKIKGVFEHFEAILNFDPGDMTTMSIQASIDANSITTRQRQRDEHLRSDEFFDVAIIERNEFDLIFNSYLEKGGIVVGNEVRIELNIEAIKIDK
jgi:polyisoprenoid-binding protein YceI